jgi:hypothetical protein
MIEVYLAASKPYFSIIIFGEWKQIRYEDWLLLNMRANCLNNAGGNLYREEGGKSQKC